MLKLLLYTFPAIVNYILGGMNFICAYRFSEAKSPGWVVGASVSMWAGIYLVTSLSLVRFITSRNAGKLIFCGGMILAFSSLGFLVFDDLYLQFLWIALTGIGSAIYCTPFQVFSRSLGAGSDAGIFAATASYTISWSLGYAAGPFLFGLLPQRVAYSLNLILSLVLAGGILWIDRSFRRPAGGHLTDDRLHTKPIPRLHQRRWRDDDIQAISQYRSEVVNLMEPSSSFRNSFSAEPAPAPKEGDAPRELLPESGDGSLVWLGWIVGFAGVIANMIVRSLVPYRGNLLGIERYQLGIVMAVIPVCQSLFAILFRFQHWIAYRRLPMVVASLCGIASMVLFGTGRNVWSFTAAALLFGCYGGYFYCSYVFHSMAHPTRSTYCLGINEALVGLAGVFGPLAGGFLSSPEASGHAFLIFALPIVVAALWGSWFIGRHFARLAAAKKEVRQD